MKPNLIGRQYRELAIKAATPVGLIIILYEMAIESLAHAKREIDTGNIEGRTMDLNHVLLIISELERSLNFEAGGEVAKRLGTFYEVARCKILEANIKANKLVIDRLSGVLCSLRDAWKIVEQKTAGTTGMELARETPRPSPVSSAPSPQDEERPQLRWSA